MSKQTISVSADALRQVLQALIGPPHYIRELQVTRGPMFSNPIDTLIDEYNATCNAQAPNHATANFPHGSMGEEVAA